MTTGRHVKQKDHSFRWIIGGTIFVLIVLVAVVILIWNSPRKTPRPVVRPSVAAPPVIATPTALPKPLPTIASPRTYVVRQGDSLSSIAQSQCGTMKDYMNLGKANKISPPLWTITPGQVLLVVCHG